MRTLEQQDTDFYQENGYLILKNSIETGSVDTLMEAFQNIVELEISMKDNSEDFKQDPLHKGLIKLKQTHPNSSAWIYETINNHLIFKQFIFNLPLERCVLELLKLDDPKKLGTIGDDFRFDIPGDTKNNREWHQDSNYFLDTESGDDVVVLWIPLNDAYKENGSVLLCQKSHKNGRLQSVHTPAGKFKSEQYTIPQKSLENFSQVPLEVSKGDVVFIHGDLIHRSGINVSNSVRYTAQLRFANVSCPSYRPRRTLPEYLEFNRRGTDVSTI